MTGMRRDIAAHTVAVGIARVGIASVAITLVGAALVASVAAAAAVASPAAETAGFAQGPIRLDAAHRQAIGLTYGTAERRAVEKVIRTVGRFDYDERKVAVVTLKVSGYIQDLFVDYTGKLVRQGDPLFSIYSPELVTAQQEYLLARQTQDRLRDSVVPGARDSATSLLRASRERLRLWDLSDQQIRELEEANRPKLPQTIHSPIAGVVTEKMAFKGQRVDPGMTLYKIADLSTIWVYADIYEYELPFVHEGQEARITLSYYPDQAFTGRITYIYPALDPKTRTAKVRFELANDGSAVLRPEMYGDVELHVPLGERLVVPETAVLDSGRRQVVFVDGGDGRLLPREVHLGSRLDHYAEVKDGLAAGERVVTSANFLVDSESKLQAAESMMSMMGAIGMGDWKMESAKPMQMGGEGAGGSTASPPAGGTAASQPAPTAAPAAPAVPPARPVAAPPGPAAAAPGLVVQEKQVGDLLIAVFPARDSATVGESAIRVRVRDAGGAAVAQATVSFDYTMDMPGMGIETAKAKELGDGLYEGIARFTMAGPWGLVVQIDRPGKPPVREKFTVRVSG